MVQTDKFLLQLLLGAVTDVSVTTPGTGYSFGYIRVSDINVAGGGSLTNAELDCIIEPKGGHGFDPFEELGGFFIILNTSFEGVKLQTLVTLQLKTILEELH